MATVIPFRAIRPRPDLAGHIASLPYDVYGKEDLLQEIRREPLSFLRVERTAEQAAIIHSAQTAAAADCAGIDQPSSVTDDAAMKEAADLLWDMVSRGELIQDEDPCYYVYELSWKGGSQTGLGACVSVDDYLSGLVKKHENTRSATEDDRVLHMEACRAQTGPVMLAYREQSVLRGLTDSAKDQAPLYEFTAEDGFTHRLWQICDPARVSQITEACADLNALYIADGHHRAAAAVRVAMKRRQQNPSYTGDEPYNYFMAVMFEEKQLHIFEYNRLVKDLNGLTPGAFLRAMDEKFCVTGCAGYPVSPGSKGEMGLYLAGSWYHLSIRPEYIVDDPVEGLDVSFLQREVLEPILGITDPRTDPRISFTGGSGGNDELMRRCSEDMAAAFAMYPTSMDELTAVADSGQVMPPKSTWFEPKLRSGLLIHEI